MPVRMKVVGRRRVDRDRTDWGEVARLQRTAGEIAGSWRLARGVYRFSTFEEADAWMKRTIVHGRGLPRPRTSPGSREP